jgi:hypothetical protein
MATCSGDCGTAHLWITPWPALAALAHQQADRVDQLRLTLLKGRQARFDGRDLGGGFGVQIGRHTVVQAQLRQLEAVPGDIEVLLGDRAGVLHAAQLDVVLCGVGEDRQQHAATVVFGDFEVGIGGFGFAAHAAPDIQFPRGGETGVPQVEGGIAVVPGRVIQAFAAVAFARVAAVAAVVG